MRAEKIFFAALIGLIILINIAGAQSCTAQPGFASPCVNSNPVLTVTNPTLSGSNVNFNVNVNFSSSPVNAIYATSYYWSAAQNQWISFTLTGTPYPGTDGSTWLTNTASKSLSVPTSAAINNVIYVVTWNYIYQNNNWVGPACSNAQGCWRLASLTVPSQPPPTDTQSPAVSVTSPTGTVSGITTVTATASDNVGVAGVQFKVDNSNIGSEDTSSPYSVSWNTAGVANGNHVLTAVARDAAGNTATSATVTVSVNNTGGSIVELSTFGSAGQGGDDTAVIQNAINTIAANGKTLHIPAGAQPYNVKPIFLPNNASLLLDADTIIQAASGYQERGTPDTAPYLSDKMINIRKVSNVKIIGNGGTFRMRKSEYTSGEQRHCLDIRRASNVYISKINCNDSGGDGLYIGEDIGDGTHSYSSNITVEDSTFNNNRRQGFSLTAGQHIFIRRSHFTNTKGTDPQAGIDIEPNIPANPISDVHIEDSYTTNNVGDGLLMSTWFLDGTSQPVDITVLRHNSSGNGLNGYESVCQSNVRGQILVDHSFTSNEGRFGATAGESATCPTVIFNYLTVTNPNQKYVTTNNAAVGTLSGGNIHFFYPTITDTSGKVDYYFSFQTSPNAPVHFLYPIQLSGAKYDPYGLLNGARVTTVNVGTIPN